MQVSERGVPGRGNCMYEGPQARACLNIAVSWRAMKTGESDMVEETGSSSKVIVKCFTFYS